MIFNRVVISSGHGLYVRGACGILDEVDEARRVVDFVANELKFRGIDVVTFHDNTSHSQNENLKTIVDFHNEQVRDLDVSVHFNAYEQVEGPMGTECLYVTESTLANQIADAIASVGFLDRGAKKRTDLYFLNNTDKPAVLIEVCFVDSETDAGIYSSQFDLICEAIASAIVGGGDSIFAPSPATILFHALGKCSHFGGPDDNGVAPDEGLAFINDVEDAPQLFLPFQPEETSGLARRLNPYVHYVACRWDYNVTPKETLLEEIALVRAVSSGFAMQAFPADWGPHENTDRVADLSPGLLVDLGLQTDDEVEVIFPYREE